MPGDNAGSTLSTAMLLSTVDGVQSLRDRVEPLNPNDYYRFSLDSVASLGLSLHSLSGDATLRLLNSRGVVVQSSMNPGMAAEAITASLEPGTYYIQVSAAASEGATPYSLNVNLQRSAIVELFWRDYATGTHAQWLMQTDGSVVTTPAAVIPDVAPHWQMEAIADFNRDGVLDIAWREYQGGTAGIWYMGGEQGTSIASRAALPTVDPSWQLAGIADFNQDGAIDLVWKHEPTGVAGVWLMNQTTPTVIDTTRALPTTGSNWHLKGLADFNGDGVVDLLWRDAVGGVNGIWLMDAANPFAIATITVLPSRAATWDIEGVVDMNRDGAPDIFWRETTTGRNEVWQMGGVDNTTVLSTAAIASTPTSWRAVPVVRSRTPAIADVAGNTPETAFAIGNLGQVAIYQESVNFTDQDDYFRFRLANHATVSLTVKGLVEDADVQLLSSDGGLIKASTHAGILPESINTPLAAGDYLIRVSSYQRATGYRLSLASSSNQPPPIVTIEASDAEAAEAAIAQGDNPGTFRISRTGNLDAALTVNVALSGTATNGVDYTTLPTSVMIPVGQSSVLLPVTVLDDALVEGGETVILTLAAGVGYNLGTRQTSTIAIADNDRPPDTAGNTFAAARNLGELSLAQTLRDYVDALDTSDLYRFSLARSASFNLVLDGLTGDADVQLFDANGTAVAGSYLDGILTERIDRTLAPGTYYIQVLPFNGSNSYYTLTVAASPLIPAPVVTLTTTDAAAAEAPIGQLQNPGQFTLTRTGDTSTELTLNYTLSGTAINGIDFNAIRSIVMPAGQSSLTVPITVIDDTALEGNETVVLTLNPGIGYTLGTTTTGTIAIADNDSLNFANFTVVDASGDGTANTVFQGGALQVSYALAGNSDITQVRLEALQNNQVVSTLGTWTTATQTGAIVHLNALTSLTGGDYQLRAVARTTTNQDIWAIAQPFRVLSWNTTTGTTFGSYTGDTLAYTNMAPNNGQIFVGRGGTDTLNLAGINRANVASLNGGSLATYNPLISTTNQAIFRGTAFDYLTLTDGREIYFQGIESLRFADGFLSLQVTPNDPFFGSQWNLHVTDVGSAWRFTQGANTVLLVSWDAGIGGPIGNITDINQNRLITDSRSASDEPAFDDAGNQDGGHGHSAINVMAAAANNTTGIAGINWNSPVLVHDVYGDYLNPAETAISLTDSITEAVNLARRNGWKVVFQGGVQGYTWFDTQQSQLEQLIQSNSDLALFAVAAGNGALDIDDRTSSSSKFYGGGVASLQTTYGNVISVGALRPGTEENLWDESGAGVTTVNRLTNATTVSLADYSNRGASLTLVAPTDTPAMNRFGQLNYFGGTSAANPNLAAIAALVWSVNPLLNATQVRQLLINTAMDLGTLGKDTTFGHGLVNADAAVRQATALTRNQTLANFYTGRSEFA